MSSFNNATNVSHHLAAAAVVARNLQQHQQSNMAQNNFKGHPLLPFHPHANPIGLKPSSIPDSLPPSPSPPSQIPYSGPPPASLPIAPQTIFDPHGGNDNRSLLTAQQQPKLSTPTTPFQPGIVSPASTSIVPDHANTSTNSDGAEAAASMAAAFPPGIPAFLQHIIHGK